MASVTGYSLFLIIVTIVMAVVIAVTTLYLLVAFLHPEDKNQAWFPKIVVCFSMFIAITTVLMFPLDVANRRACNPQILLADCTLTIPMETLWFSVYIISVVLVYLVTPFTLFFYEADSDMTLAQRIRSASIYTVGAALIFGIVLVIVWAVGGNVEHETVLLSSGAMSIASFNAGAGAPAECVLEGGPTNMTALDCDALQTKVPPQIWEQPTTFPVYVVAAASILGWLLLMVMAGVGLVALPLDMILAFFARPQKTITKTQYMDKAKDIGKRAKDLYGLAMELKRQENGSGRTRKSRQQTRALNKELSALEDDEAALEKQFPQGEDGEARWVMYVLSFWLSLFGGILFSIVALTWVIHIVIYVILKPPLHPFLNSFFNGLDTVFPLFGVGAFSIWCFFLILAAIKGLTKLGLNFGFIQLYPMKLGATMMSSFLVNSALVLLASTAVVQFCATAFAGYAKETAIQEVIGNEVFNLKGVRWVFGNNVFVIVMLVFSGLTAIYLMVRGPVARRHKPLTLEEIYAMG